jgi:hypothetical protein
MMVMKTKCVRAFKDSWGSGSIVSIGLLSGENGNGILAGEDVVVDCLP